MALTEKLAAIANAIRSKTGKTDGLTLEQMPSEIEGIETGGSGGAIEPTASYLTLGEVSKTLAAYPFIPKYKNELIVWNTTGDNAPVSGSVTAYAFIAWIINGKAQSECGWISGAMKTSPWSDENYSFARRTAEFTLDETGHLNVQTGTWGYIGSNNTCTIYEIPLSIGLEV